MQAETPLDEAHATMQSAPEDDAARLRYYERLVACELFMMLEKTPEDTADNVTPVLFDHDGARYVLVFDRQERLAAFAGQATPYVAVSGRTVVDMLAGQGIGLGVNLDVAPSAILLPDHAVGWLHDMIGQQPDAVEAKIVEVSAPKGLPDQLISALDARLATAMGLAQSAYLVAVTYDSGARGHVLAFVAAVPDAQNALSQTASEALTFSGIEAGAMDIGFFDADAPILKKMEAVALRFDLPQPQEIVTQVRAAPGSDPENPPKLK